MTELQAKSHVFGQLATELLARGITFRFEAKGRSMLPVIQDGDLLHVQTVDTAKLKIGDIVLFKSGSEFKAHRIIRKQRGIFVTRGDAGMDTDGTIRGEHIVGKVVAKECATTGEMFSLHGSAARLRFLMVEARRQAAIYFRRRRTAVALSAFLSLLLLSLSTSAHAQVVLDATTSASARLTTLTNSFTFAHTSTGSNLVLVVGVSMNIFGGNTSTVSGVIYNGVALTRAGFHNDSANQRRTEMWYLIAPATGNHNVTVTANIPAGTIGAVAGATTFTGADQTSPIRTYASNDGNTDAVRVDVASAVNDMVLDTLATAGNRTVTSAGGTQVQQWALTTGALGTDVDGYGSTRTGSPSVPMSEILSANSPWSVSAVSIRPLQADLSVTVGGSAAQFPTNFTYTITVTNNGASAASGAVLTDTLASGLVFVSSTPSQGSCSGTSTITCNLGAMSVGATATVTVTATPTAPGGYTNSASVNATTADLNTSNNSATGVSFSELTACTTNTVTAGGNLGGTINTYYPGTATANKGATSITLGAATGAGTAIASGDLVLIIQMQDAAINSSNSSSYGNGLNGSGSTNLNNAGAYEYATATTAVAVSGGTLTVTAAGPGGGLLYTYTSAVASAAQGARTFQVVRVPNYSTATLTSTLTASAWNGSTGGILALNVSGALTLNGATVSVDGRGFRGGAGLRLNGSAAGAATTDYLSTAPAAYVTPPVAGTDGPKGEGIAGTPRWVESGGAVVATNQTYAEGYPNGSMARGAPGSAGGGGTDGDPTTAQPNGNSQNSGGGGGANGGAGGSGGNSWSSNLTSGGLGGAAFPGSVSRVAMGGGGGAASRNNSPGDNQASSGSAGGGIVMIRAGSLTGTATITANGSAAYNLTLNDGGGGAGAGGSVIILSGGGGEGGLTVQAHGGRGGDAWDTQGYTNPNRHGPGGGGGGGVVLLSGAAASIDVNGGANGVTLTPGVPYGATAGAAGVSATNVSLILSPGPHSAAICTDVAIAKSGSPNPVLQNATLTYTLAVTNNGPQTATAVVAVDTLPTQVSYVSSSSTQGTCTQTAGVVTCTVGNMLNAAVATITITATAVTPSQAVNTAVVNSATPDPVLSNNTATITTLIEFPNVVRMGGFTATQTANGVLLSWNTGGELHNLGFNLYRDVAGEKVRLNPSLIAGSSLLMREALEQHGAKTYGWIDHSSNAGGLYWLEDVDLNGTRTMHGPVSTQGVAAVSRAQAMTRAMTIQELAQVSGLQTTASSANSPLSHVRETIAQPKISESTQSIGFELAARPAVKIFVDHEGWYRITQPQLVAAGLSPAADARSLHLFAEGVEHPMRITGAASGFGPQAAIEFYGTAIDTPYSAQRVYWLALSNQPGMRISEPSASGSAGPQAQSFIQTLELKPRTTYFAALLREDTDNFFGPLVSPTSSVLTFMVSNLAAGQGTLFIALQGVTQSQQHAVTVAVNGATLGDVNFDGQQKGKASLTIPAGILASGSDTITLTAQQGENDLSLVDYVDISFPHTFTAESDLLKFQAGAGENVTVGGFLHPPTRLLDVTNPALPFQVAFQTTTQPGSFALRAVVPWSSTGTHKLLALSDTQFAVPVALAPHRPSSLHTAQGGAEVVILAAPQFTAQVQPLAALHQAEGKTVALINVDDVYDEFSFGERTPYAVRNFLRTAIGAWKNKPRYLLLAGDASVDPRDYLGFGFLDFVPTKVVVTSELKTASDDWFSDFDNTGFAKIATGRLPARTTADAQTMVAKILGYANGQAGSWTNQSMMVADVDDPSVSFSQAAQAVQRMLPQTMNVTDVFAGVVGPATARQDLLAGINSGQLLVNYNGHGSVQIWSGSDLFDDTAASSLTNGNRLPVFVIMNCLNGFFHDVYTESLAESLMLARNGGAVAVWASSGLTVPDPQFQMDQTLMQTLFSQPSITLGDAVLFAKSGIGDQDVRRTFILFGDPLMRLKQPQSFTPIRFAKPRPSPALLERSNSGLQSRTSLAK
jgi:signal peptidase I